MQQRYKCKRWILVHTLKKNYDVVNVKNVSDLNVLVEKSIIIKLKNSDLFMVTTFNNLQVNVARVPHCEYLNLSKDNF